jgi:hypothetical protein
MRLDDRWGTEYWKSDAAPPAPDGPCDACGRRAAWLTIGGTYTDEEIVKGSDDDYLDRHPVQLCGWCKLEFSSPPENRVELDRILALAREQSVSWRWRAG